MMQHLYTRGKGNDEHKELFIVGKNSCDSCGKQLKNGTAAIHLYHQRIRQPQAEKERRRTITTELILCEGCSLGLPAEITMIGQSQIRHAIITETMPEGAHQATGKTEMIDTKHIINAMTEYRHEGKIIDRTKLAGRDVVLEGTERIGKPIAEVVERYYEKQNLLDDEGIDVFLESFKPAAPLEYHGKKKIEEAKKHKEV